MLLAWINSEGKGGEKTNIKNKNKKQKQEELDKAQKLNSFEQDVLSKTSPPPTL